MKNNNLKNALKKFNAIQQSAESRIEILNPTQQGAVKGGTIGCPCKKNQTVTCSQQYTQGK